MRCTAVRRYAFLYLDSELGPETSWEIASHLEDCAPCRRRVEGERELEGLFRCALGRLEEGHRLAWERAARAALPSARRRTGAAALVASAVLGAACAAFVALRAGESAADFAAADPTPRELDWEDFEMKPTNVLGAAALVSVVSATTTAVLLAPDAGDAEPVGEPRDLQVRIDALLARQAALEEDLAELRLQARERVDAPPAGSRAPVVTEADIARMVAEAIDRRLQSPAPSNDSRALDVAAVMRDLLDPALDEAERARIWQEVRESGQIDRIVAEFERRAEASPNDPVARVELGEAYGHKMLTTGGGPEAGRWGSKGAAAFEEALELDPGNWEARFHLARHFSYADMRGDSIRHLEVLIGQQADRPPEEKHAGAYLLLGNLYMDRGDEARAREVWSDGLARFPGDGDLDARLRAQD